MTARPGPVLVTGANSGIGLATTLHLAGRGWDVWGTVRSTAKATTLRRAAASADVGERVHPVVLDVADHDAVVARWKRFPAFYAVVNNAGYSELGAVEEVPASRAKAQLDVNLVTPAVIAGCALPAMRERGAGRIVMVSSIAGRSAVLPLNAWYHASKFGLEALSDVLRMEVAGFGVRVVVVEPGFFKTNIEARARDLAEELDRPESPYAAAYRRSTTALDLVSRFAPDPKLVARTIATAIESRRPLKRYLVGADAVALAAAQRVTPRSVTDAAARLVTGLVGKPESFL